MTVNPLPHHLIVVLAAHGAPPTDYPPMRVGLLMMLEFAGNKAERLRPLRSWRERLTQEVIRWPRTPENDPYKRAVDDLAQRLAARLGCRVIASYNEFCAPTVDEAIDQAVEEGARRVIVIPTMLLRGNSHTEHEIYASVIQARQRHPDVSIEYAWPFHEDLITSLFAEQVAQYLQPLSQPELAK